jgi:coenzyme F420-reducing hydrogenase beta subunit
MSGVIQQILEHPGRYVVTGIPCFIKALRLASLKSSVLKDRIAFTLGIVCGHLKSTAFAELFAWQCGIEPKQLRAIDFRTKLEGRAANGYAVTVSGLRSGEPVSVTRPTAELYGADWGHGFFKYKACDFCDDVVGETADVSIGDAWLPEYEGDPRGTNVIIVRSPVIHALLVEAAEKRRLHLDEIPAAKAVESQAGGFRHRREGLAFRLHSEDTVGNWRPKKRVEASCEQLSRKRRKIYLRRYRLGQDSHRAFAEAKEANDLELFRAKMLPKTKAYDRLYHKPLLIRIINRIKRLCSNLISKTSAI